MSTNGPAAIATAEVPVLPRRGRRWRRLFNSVLGLAIVVVLATGVLRVTSLWGIPDAPEPFDVEAFRSRAIADEENAVVLFDEARRMLGGEHEVGVFGLMGRQPKDYVEEKPETLAWIDAHRPAMEVWRLGTDRPDAAPIGGVAPIWGAVLPDNLLHAWLRVAAIEASRLAHDGDLEGAWRWHRARLRATLLMGRGRGMQTHHFLSQTFSEVARAARDWAEGPTATVPLLRRAIADVEAMAALHASEADSLKADYLGLLSDLDRFTDPGQGHLELASRVTSVPRSVPLGTLSRVVPPEPLRPLYARVASFLEAEPERSRRIARMIFANWLAQADKRPADRPATVSTYPLVFDEDAGPTPSLSPSALARRAATAPYFAIARVGPPPAWWYVVDQWPTTYRADRQARADLILALADRIYEIEKGGPPPNVEALIGTVLPRLPDDYDPTAGDPSLTPKPQAP